MVLLHEIPLVFSRFGTILAPRQKFSHHEKIDEIIESKTDHFDAVLLCEIYTMIITYICTYIYAYVQTHVCDPICEIPTSYSTAQR